MASRNRTLVVSQYPVLDKQRAEIEGLLGEMPEYLVVSTSAASGYLGLVVSLWQSDFNKVYLMLADETSLSMRPILQLLSVAIGAESRYLLTSDNRVEEYNFLDCGLAALSIVGALVAGLISVATNTFDLIAMKHKKRFYPDNPLNLKELAYLRTNLWLGVQAGGAVSHTIGIVEAAIKAGKETKYFSADTFQSDRAQSLEMYRIPHRMPYIVPRELNHFIYHREFVAKSKEFLQDYDGVLYQRTSLGNFSGAALSASLGVPLVIEYNGSELWMARNWGTPFLFSRLIQMAEEVSLRHAHLIVTVSESLRDELVERGVADDRILVQPNGVDTDVFDSDEFSSEQKWSFRERLNIAKDAIVVTFVGTFGPWHGAEVLAEAAQELLQSGQGDVQERLHFLFIGDGVRRPEVETATKKFIADHRVTLTGLIQPASVPLALASSDILVAPTVPNPDKSPFFGSPTKLFEYMSAGRPIIASKIGQIGDILANCPSVEELTRRQDMGHEGTEFGVLVAPGDIGELATAISKVASSAEWRLKAGASARELVKDKFTWDRHFESIENRLIEVVKESQFSPVRIMVNGLHSKSGGGVTYLRNLIPILCADPRLEIHVCLNEKQIPLFEPWLDGATLHKVPLDDSLWRTILFEQFSLPKWARRINADVTFSPANYGPIFAPRTVVLLRNALSVAFVERRLPKILYWAMLYLGTLSSVFAARKVISVSQYASKATVGNMLAWSSDKFLTVPHGISAIFESDSSIEREENSLLFVSDIYVQKNLHGFFKSLAILRMQFPHLKLRVAGAPVDLDYDQRIRTLIHELKLDGVVEFLGNLDPAELTQEYRRTTVFVFPSTVETFGNPLVEAMACGAPIACSKTAAMPEVAGEAAEYFDPYDAEEMARVVGNLLKDEARRDELSRLGIERSKIYSWEETARKTADVLIDAARN